MVPDLKALKLGDFSHALHFLALIVSNFVFWLHSFLLEIAGLHIVGNQSTSLHLEIQSEYLKPSSAASSTKFLGGLWLIR